MSKQARIKKRVVERDVYDSETITEKIREKTPWIFGKKLRKPKILFFKMRSRRLSLPSPSKALGLILIYILLFILQVGIVYLIYKEPPALGANAKGEPIFLHPGVHESFIIEGIVASILIFISSTGFILLYQASKYSFNRRIALRILIIGVILIVITFIALQYMINEKM